MNTSPRLPTYLPGDLTRLEHDIARIESDKKSYIEQLENQLKNIEGREGFELKVIELKNQLAAAPAYYDTSIKRLQGQLATALEAVGLIEAEQLEQATLLANAKREGKKLQVKNAWIQGGGSEKDFDEVWPGMLNEIIRKEAMEAQTRAPQEVPGWSK